MRELEEKIKMLVRKVVEDYLRNQLKQPITILLTYQTPNRDEVLETVSQLEKLFDVTLVVSKEWHQVTQPKLLLEEASQQELLAVLDKSAALIIPAGTYSLLAKLALSLDDETPAWLAIQYQLKGKPVIIANNHLKLSVEQQIMAPATVQARIQSYIKQIQADKVKWVPLKNLTETVKDQLQSEKKTLILAKHIEAANQEGVKELKVPTQFQITPSAKDLAKELKIQISSEKGG